MFEKKLENVWNFNFTFFSEEINLLNCINDMLKERHEIDTNFNHLHLKFTQMQTDEHDRKDKVRIFRKKNSPFLRLP